MRDRQSLQPHRKTGDCFRGLMVRISTEASVADFSDCSDCAACHAESTNAATVESSCSAVVESLNPIVEEECLEF